MTASLRTSHMNHNPGGRPSGALSRLCIVVKIPYFISISQNEDFFINLSETY